MAGNLFEEDKQCNAPSKEVISRLVLLCIFLSFPNQGKGFARQGALQLPGWIAVAQGGVSFAPADPNQHNQRTKNELN